MSRGVVRLSGGSSVWKAFLGLAALVRVALWASQLHAAEIAPQTQPPPGAPPNVVATIPAGNEFIKDEVIFVFDKPLRQPSPGEGRLLTEFIDSPTTITGPAIFGANYLRLKTGPLELPEYLSLSLKNIEAADGGRLERGEQIYRFATRPFTLSETWEETAVGGRSVLGLGFNLAVDPAAIRERLKIVDTNGAKVDFEISPRDEKAVLVSFSSETPYPAHITIDRSLAPKEGALTPSAPIDFWYPKAWVVRLEKVEYVPRSNRIQIPLTFSQPVAFEHIAEFMSISKDGRTTETLGVSSESRSNRVTLSQTAGGWTADAYVEVRKGLPGLEAGGVQETMRMPIPVPPPQRNQPVQPPRIESARLIDDESRGPLMEVRLNRNPTEPGLAQYIQIQPSVEIESIGLSGQRNAIEIVGNFKEKQEYRVVLTTGLLFTGGTRLSEDLLQIVPGLQFSPSVQILGNNEKYYFPRRQGPTFTIEYRRAKTVKLTTYRVFANNVPLAIRELESRRYRNFDNLVDKWAQKIETKELEIVPDAATMQKKAVDLSTVLAGDAKGIFVIGAEASNGHETDIQNYVLALVTDIGATAHWTDRQLDLYAHDLSTLAPIPGAKVSIYSHRNQLMATMSAGQDGIARVGALDESLGRPAVAIVETAGDYTFLELEPKRDDEAKLDPALPAFDSKAYEGFLYGDRELYRPGETVHVRFLVRTNFGDALSSVPLNLRILKPNYQELTKQLVVSSAFGTGELDIPTQHEYPTGLYRVWLEIPGSDANIGQGEFFLEEFVPSRIEVKVSTNEKNLVVGTDYQATIKAEHMFGGPAVGRNVSADLVFDRGEVKIPGYEEFQFGNEDKIDEVRSPLGETTTGENGEGLLVVSPKFTKPLTQPISANVAARVYELGGSSVAGSSSVTIFPGEWSAGIAATADNENDMLKVRVAAVKPDGTPADVSSLTVLLEECTESYYYQQRFGYNEVRWNEVFRAKDSRDAALTAGRGEVAFKIKDYGRYRVRVNSPSGQYATVHLYGGPTSIRVLRDVDPQLIRLRLDKSRYLVGDEAELHIYSPYDGKAVVVLQGENLHSMNVVDIVNGEGLLRFQVQPGHFPMAWIDVTALHAGKPADYKVHPYSSFATASFKVEEPRRRLDIAFPNLPDEWKPNQRVNIDVEVRDGKGAPQIAELTIAAVDEGIHQLSGYKNPDPFGWLLRTRRPDIRRAHYYDLVSFDSGDPDVGGGDDALARRLNAEGENWIETVALWSGVVTTNAEGKASVSFDLPDFDGKLRIVALAVNRTQVGAQARNVFVRRNYMLQTSLPRFTLPGDAFSASVSLYNRTASPIAGTLAWKTEGALAAADAQQPIRIPANGETRVIASLGAGDATGQGAVKWTATIDSEAGQRLETVEKTQKLPVRSPAAFESHYKFQTIQPGAEVEFRNDEFVENAAAGLQIEIGVNPLMRLQKALEYAVGYPYGCIEQTASRLMPLNLLRQQTGMLAPLSEKFGDLDHYVASGIEHMFSMQTESGGFSTWPGGNTPNAYGSVYALHALALIAQDRTIPLPPAAMDRLKEYVRGIMTRMNTQTQNDVYTRSYATYVLTMFGDLDAARMIEPLAALQRANPDNTFTSYHSRTSYLLLAAALAQSTRDADRVRAFMARGPRGSMDVDPSNEVLSSDARNTAIELIALTQIGAEETEQATLAQKLMADLEHRHHGSTQESALMVAALSQYLGKLAQGGTTPGAVITGADGTWTLDSAELKRFEKIGARTSFGVKNTGDMPLLAYVTASGVPVNPPGKTSNGGLSIARRLFTSSGDEISSGPIELAATYIVSLDVECERDLKSVVLLDMLPAGFEIINPRLDKNSAPSTWDVEMNVTPSYTDLRDDRVAFIFDSLGKGVHRFFYIVNASTPGTFRQPAARAECMYELGINATTEMGELTIVAQPAKAPPTGSAAEAATDTD